MGEVYRGTQYKPAEDIQDRKVVVVPKVEGKIFLCTLNSKNCPWICIAHEMELSFIPETSENYEMRADSQGTNDEMCRIQG